MLDQLKDVKEKQKQATSARKKGDAQRKSGREDEAKEAYRAGVAALTEAVQMLSADLADVEAMSSPLPREQRTVLDELVETLGARGGLLQRLGCLTEASNSYTEGAFLEKRFALPGTYNRLNALKCSLLTGEKRLRELEPQLHELADLIETNLRDLAQQAAEDKSKSLINSGWAWADLGDCMALLDNREAARRAYSTFISKAETKSPERTLDVLRGIAAKLVEFADPDAPRLQSAVDLLESQLTA
jgi:hypothetical protein